MSQPRRRRFTDEVVTLAHGAGGKATAALVDDVFLAAFAPGERGELSDATSLVLLEGTPVFSTDSFVVRPRTFPGGAIGSLAVHGTVNDLAMRGAVPQWLSAAFVIEEGFSVAELRAVARDMADAARAAGVSIVTGDTKVVDRGAADGLFITTAGVGVVPTGRAPLTARSVRAGDVVLVSGRIADHGMAVMLARGNLAIEADISSDSAPLGGLVAALLAASATTRWLRDPTRGGVAGACNELAHDTNLAVVLDEASIPVAPATAAACDLLGIDPVHVANEGKLVAVVPAEEAAAALTALRAHPLGLEAAVIGEIREDPAGLVVMRTSVGSTRIVDMLVGDPLPRIC